MKKQTTTSYSTSYSYPQPFHPEVHVAVKNNRVKSYEHEGENRIYMEEGTEFQLEFNNDSSYHTKAVIEINGKQQGSALVLRPYQRFYLDRFMDEQKRFKFNTFMTGNDDIEKLKEVIEKNGRIKVSFYKQYIPQPVVTWTTVKEVDENPYYPYSPPIWRDGTSKPNWNKETLTSNYCCNIKGQSKSLDFDTDDFNDFDVQASLRSEEPEEIETGRVEAGSKSGQNFVQSNEVFDLLPSVTFEYHIVPVSHKPKPVKVKKAKRAKDVIVADDIRTYCPGCGRRIKKGWNFCAGCGHKF